MMMTRMSRMSENKSDAEIDGTKNDEWQPACKIMTEIMTRIVTRTMKITWRKWYRENDKKGTTMIENDSRQCVWSQEWWRRWQSDDDDKSDAEIDDRNCYDSQHAKIWQKWWQGCWQEQASMQNYDRNDDEDVDKNTPTCKTRTEMMTRKLTRTMKIRWRKWHSKNDRTKKRQYWIIEWQQRWTHDYNNEKSDDDNAITTIKQR